MATRGGIKAGHAYILIEALDKTEAAFKTVANRLNNLSQKFLITGRQTALYTAALTIPMVSAINTARDFSDEILYLQSKLRATDQDMIPLIGHIKELAKSSTFVALEITQAASALAEGGFSRKEIADSLRAVMDLSRGARMGLDESAKLVVDSIRTFELSSAEANKVVDAFIIASKNGTINVQELAQSFSYSALSANQMGMSLEETLAALSAMSLRMLKSTKAGTSLNQMIQSLSISHEKLAAIGVSGFTKEGGEKPILNILTELALATRKMSTLERSRTLVDIFNVRGVRASLALADDMGKAINEMSATMEEITNSAGFARSAADLMDRDLGGAIRRIIASINLLKIEIGLSLTAKFKAMSDHIAPLIHGLAIFVRNNKHLVVQISVAISVLAAYSVVMLTLAGTLKILALALATTLTVVNFILLPLTVLKVTFLALIGILPTLGAGLLALGAFLAPIAIVLVKIVAVAALFYGALHGIDWLLNRIDAQDGTLLAGYIDAWNRNMREFTRVSNNAATVAVSTWTSVSNVFRQAIANVTAYLRRIYMSVTEYFAEVFGHSSGIATETWSRLVDAIKQGDLEAAVRIAVIGIRGIWEVLLVDMRIGWLRLSFGLEEMIIRTTSFFKESWYEAIKAIYEALKNPISITPFKALQSIPGEDPIKGLIRRLEELEKFRKNPFGRTMEMVTSVGEGIANPDAALKRVREQTARDLSTNQKQFEADLVKLQKTLEYEMEKFRMELGKQRIIQADLGGKITDEQRTLKDVFKDLADSVGQAAQEIAAIAAPDTVMRGSPDSFDTLWKNQQLSILMDQRSLLQQMVDYLTRPSNNNLNPQFRPNTNSNQTILQILEVGR